MFLENIVFDAVDPSRLGRFWETVLGTEQLTDSDGYETRFEVPDGPTLDLCFQPVSAPEGPRRLQLIVAPTSDRPEFTERLVEAGARPGEDPGTWLDPEGNAFGVTPSRARSGSLAAIRLEVTDQARELDFWSWLTGWSRLAEGAVLQHPSGLGPLLELCPETAPKTAGKNPIHLDVRLEPTDDRAASAREISERGGRGLNPDWGDLPWRTFQDPSGNEVCLLPAPAQQ